MNCPMGGYLDHQATAHGTSMALGNLEDTVRNANTRDQRYVWVPFHFLPGCQGATTADNSASRISLSQAHLVHRQDLLRRDEAMLFDGIVEFSVVRILEGLRPCGRSDTIADIGDSSRGMLPRACAF